MRIDAHQHFWRYDPVAFDWIEDEMALIRKDHLPPDLERELKPAGIDGAISVQARQCLAETGWLLELAEDHDFIKGVVGWVELASPRVEAVLERLMHPKLKGLRHVVQGEPGDEFILGADFNRGIRSLARFKLVYDILIFPRHLPFTIRFVDRHPAQIFVLDHMAKPLIRDGVMEPWARQIRELARRPNVYCKVSGMVTEADHKSWTEAQLRPYFDVVLSAFGPDRLMFGSEWPVCLVACEYHRWHRLVSKWISGLSLDEQARILGGTATAAYKL
jgi:L-fuconolactonase